MRRHRFLDTADSVAWNGERMTTGPERERREIHVRLSKRGADEREFDERFWRELGPRARLEALWDMVLEAEAWKGRSGDQPRLQRSVLRVERR